MIVRLAFKVRPAGTLSACFSLAVLTSASLGGAATAVSAADGSVLETPSAVSETITLDEAIARALAGPRLYAHASEAEAAEARARQAGLWPNPEIEVEVEEFGGPGALREFESAEITLQLAQTLELGGKPGKRKRAELAGSEAANLDFQWQSRALVRDVTHHFSELLAAQERLDLAREVVELQSAVHGAVAKRVAAGMDPPLEKTRAQVELAEAGLASRAAERALDVARQGLAATWGAREADFARGADLEAMILPPPDESECLAGLLDSPQMIRWLIEEERALADLALAKALRVPDLTLFAGVRQALESDTRTLVAGLAFPLPLFDRNQGGVAEADLLASSATASRQAAEAELRLELAQTHARLTDAYAAAVALTEEIVPAAESLFDAALSGYRSGKIGYLKMLDAQRTLFAARSQQIEARADYLRARADLQLLTGPLPVDVGVPD